MKIFGFYISRRLPEPVTIEKYVPPQVEYVYGPVEEVVLFYGYNGNTRNGPYVSCGEAFKAGAWRVEKLTAVKIDGKYFHKAYLQNIEVK